MSRKPKKMSAAEFGEIIDAYGWHQEHGRADAGDFFVHIWSGETNLTWRAEKHSELPSLYEMAVESMERRLGSRPRLYERVTPA